MHVVEYKNFLVGIFVICEYWRFTFSLLAMTKWNINYIIVIWKDRNKETMGPNEKTEDKDGWSVKICNGLLVGKV